MLTHNSILILNADPGYPYPLFPPLAKTDLNPPLWALGPGQTRTMDYGPWAWAHRSCSDLLSERSTFRAMYFKELPTDKSDLLSE